MIDLDKTKYYRLSDMTEVELTKHLWEDGKVTYCEPRAHRRSPEWDQTGKALWEGEVGQALNKAPGVIGPIFKLADMGLNVLDEVICRRVLSHRTQPVMGRPRWKVGKVYPIQMHNLLVDDAGRAHTLAEAQDQADFEKVETNKPNAFEVSAAKVQAHDGWHTGKPEPIEIAGKPINIADVEIVITTDDDDGGLRFRATPKAGAPAEAKKGPVQLKRVIVPGRYKGLYVRSAQTGVRNEVDIEISAKAGSAYLRRLAAQIIEMAEVLEEE